MALMSETMNIAGSGFYPGGTVTITITPYSGTVAGAAVYTQSTTASSTGAISISIPLSNIPGIESASSIQIHATDVTTATNSNMVTIPITVTTINPQLSYGGGSITLYNVE